MRFVVVVVLLVMNSSIFAATNTMVTVCSTTTNAVSAQVSRRYSKSSRPQCEATTLSGNRCKRRVSHGSKYCSQHAAIISKREQDKGEKGAQQGSVSNDDATTR